MQYVIFSLSAVLNRKNKLSPEELGSALFCLLCAEEEFLEQLGPAMETREPADEYNLSMHARVAKMDGRLIYMPHMLLPEIEDSLNRMLKASKLEPLDSRILWAGDEDIVGALIHPNKGKIKIVCNRHEFL